MQKIWVWSLGWEDPLEKGMATHRSILAWRIPWTEEPDGLQSVGSQRARHDWSKLAGTHPQLFSQSSIFKYLDCFQITFKRDSLCFLHRIGLHALAAICFLTMFSVHLWSASCVPVTAVCPALAIFLPHGHSSSCPSQDPCRCSSQPGKFLS